MTIGKLIPLGTILAMTLGFSIPAGAQIIDTFKLVGTGASRGAQKTIPNNWGGHQARIVRHEDETVRVAYLLTDDNGLKWRVMRRSPGANSEFVQEGQDHRTYDDVTLLHNQINDTDYVTAWPGGVPTLYRLPDFQETPMGAGWPQKQADNRQYSNTAIGADGTLCLKAWDEPNTVAHTTASITNYACAAFSAPNTYTWPQITSQPIGKRYAYDYLHVYQSDNAPAQRPTGLYGVSKRDLYYTASNVPNSDTVKYSAYVKNGIRSYSTGLTSAAGWREFDFIPEMYAAPGATVPPEAVINDSLIDSKGRLIVTYHVSDPSSAAVNGNYIYIADAKGNTLMQGAFDANVSGYGSTRVYEDSLQRLWLLWINQGTRSPGLKIYRIIEGTKSQTFTLDQPVDLSAGLQNHVPDGYAYLAAPRGGSKPSLYVDMLVNTCSKLMYIDANTPVDLTQCYGDGTLTVYYARIALPK